MSRALRIFQGEFGRVALLDMDKSLISHAHSECHVLFKASGADTYFTVRDRSQPLTDRSAVLINTWEPHFYDHRPDVPRTLILALYIDTNWLATINQSLSLSACPQFFTQPCVELTPPIRRLADDLVGAMVSLQEVPQERVECMLFDLMIAVIERYSQWRHLSHLISPRLFHASDARIRRAIGYIRAKSGSHIDMGQLANECGLSRAHFFTLFRRHTHMTPNVFHNMLRMERACERLASYRPGTLGLLSEELGFSEQSHFTRFFRQHLGVTPSEYQRVVDLYSRAGPSNTLGVGYQAPHHA